MNFVHGKRWLLLLLAVLALYPLGAPGLYSAFYVDLMTKIMIFGVLLLGFDILAGYTGLVSLGHAMFFGIGGYCAAYTMNHLTTNLVPVLLLALTCVLVVGAVVGYFSTQTKEIFFVFLTLAFAQFLYLAAFNLTELTGGDNGMTLPRLTLGIPGLWNWEVPRPGGFYYLVLAVLAFAYLICRRIIASPFGVLLVGVRENEERMKFLGYNTRLLKIKSFMVSVFLATTAGVLFGAYQNFVSPGMFHWSLSGDFILMSVLGGMGTLVGPVLGGGLILWLSDELSSFTENWMIIIGSFFVLTILLAPQGVMGSFKRRTRGGKGAS